MNNNLIYTVRGQNWLHQFDANDVEYAERLATCLTLVSHNEFERNIRKLICDEVNNDKVVTAFFAAREVELSATYFEQAKSSGKNVLNALSEGNDHGSEARIANIIRNISKTDPDNILNHPTIDEMRKKKCRKIIFVDDFIGSGRRISDFYNSFWNDKTIRSWFSLGLIEFKVLAYSGTLKGIKQVTYGKRHPTVEVIRDCPTIDTMPWSSSLRKRVSNLCYKYGKYAHKNNRLWRGYGGTLATIIFEHGCPNNVPAILWGSFSGKSSWKPIFEHRNISYGLSSYFPPQISAITPKSVMLDVGQKTMSTSEIFDCLEDEGNNILMILGLIAMGQRRYSTLSYVTGLSNSECAHLLNFCIENHLITISRRITKHGSALLKKAKKLQPLKAWTLDEGSNNYYPTQLRETSYD